MNNNIVLFSFDSNPFYITVFAKMVFKKFSVPGNRMLDSKLFQFKCKLQDITVFCIYNIIVRKVSVRVTYGFSDFIQHGQGKTNRQFWLIIN